jgi:hypothetical protein
MPETSFPAVPLQDGLRRMHLGDATAADELLRLAGDRPEWLSAAYGG